MRTIAVVLAALAAASAAPARPAPPDPMGAVRLVDVRYRAHDGYARNAWLMPGIRTSSRALSRSTPVDMASRFREFPEIAGGRGLQQLAVQEIGGTPARDPRAWAARSPLDDVRAIADSNVPLQIWWSRRDRIVVDGAGQSRLLYREIRRLNPSAPVLQVVGSWRHTAEMHWNRRLPHALVL